MDYQEYQDNMGRVVRDNLEPEEVFTTKLAWVIMTTGFLMMLYAISWYAPLIFLVGMGWGGMTVQLWAELNHILHKSKNYFEEEEQSE